MGDGGVGFSAMSWVARDNWSIQPNKIKVNAGTLILKTEGGKNQILNYLKKD